MFILVRAKVQIGQIHLPFLILTRIDYYNEILNEWRRLHSHLDKVDHKVLHYQHIRDHRHNDSCPSLLVCTLHSDREYSIVHSSREYHLWRLIKYLPSLPHQTFALRFFEYLSSLTTTSEGSSCIRAISSKWTGLILAFVNIWKEVSYALSFKRQVTFAFRFRFIECVSLIAITLSMSSYSSAHH